MPSDKNLRRGSRSNSRSERRERSLSHERSTERRRRRQKYHRPDRHSRSSSSDRSRRTTKSPDNYRQRRRSNSRQERAGSRYKRTRSRRSPTSSSETDSESSVKSYISLENKRKTESKSNFDLGSLDIDQQVKKDVIEHINSECFVPKNFVSSTKISEKVIIDLHNETISVTPPSRIETEDDNICHQNFCGDQNQRMEKWIRKMFNFRQKCFQE